MFKLQPELNATTIGHIGEHMVMAALAAYDANPTLVRMDAIDIIANPYGMKPVSIDVKTKAKVGADGLSFTITKGRSYNARPYEQNGCDVLALACIETQSVVFKLASDYAGKQSAFVRNGSVDNYHSWISVLQELAHGAREVA